MPTYNILFELPADLSNPTASFFCKIHIIFLGVKLNTDWWSLREKVDNGLNGVIDFRILLLGLEPVKLI